MSLPVERLESSGLFAIYENVKRELGSQRSAVGGIVTRAKMFAHP
jgi:hypothetical protein